MKGRIKLNNPKGMATVFSVRAEIRRFCGMYDRENAHEGPIPDAVRHSMAPVRYSTAIFRIRQKYK